MIQQVLNQESAVAYSSADEFRDLDVPSGQHYIGAWTSGIQDKLSIEEQDTIELVFNSQVPRGDAFYAFDIHRASLDYTIKVFVCDNGERGFTAMLANEY